jgi:hypothetical protein
VREKMRERKAIDGKEREGELEKRDIRKKPTERDSTGRKSGEE